MYLLKQQKTKNKESQRRFSYSMVMKNNVAYFHFPTHEPIMQKFEGRKLTVFLEPARTMYFVPGIYNYIYKYKCVFFTLRQFFLFRPRVFPRALVSVAHRELARTPYASLGLGRGPWHVLWGLKVARPLGEAFRARRAIQVHANPPVHIPLPGINKIKKMSNVSCDISDLECHQYRQTLHTWFKCFPPTPVQVNKMSDGSFMCKLKECPTAHMWYMGSWTSSTSSDISSRWEVQQNVRV